MVILKDGILQKVVKTWKTQKGGKIQEMTVRQTAIETSGSELQNLSVYMRYFYRLSTGKRQLLQVILLR